MKKFIRNVPLECLAELFQNLEFLGSAGLPLEEALATIAQAPPHRRLLAPLQHIQSAMHAGLLLSASMAQQPTIFPPFVTQVIAVGEKTGKMAPYFQEITDHLRWQMQLQNQISKALRYAILMFCIIVVMIMVVMTFLLSQIEGLLLSLGVAQLPLATRALLWLGHWCVTPSVFGGIFLGIVLSAVPAAVLLCIYRQPAFMRHVPIIGPLLIAKNMTYYLKTLAALLQASVDLLPALAHAQSAVIFPYLAKQLAQAPHAIAEGSTLSQAFATQPHFPPLALRLIRLGENTGRLPVLVAQAATGYQRHYAQRVERLVQRLHPTLVMTLGLLILWIVLATLLPLYNHLDGGLG